MKHAALWLFLSIYYEIFGLLSIKKGDDEKVGKRAENPQKRFFLWYND